MNRGNFLNLQRLLQKIYGTRKKTYIIASLTLAALPAGAAFAMSKEDDKPANSHVTISTNPSSPSTEPSNEEATKSQERAESRTDAGTSSNNSSTTVTVNGQDVPMPEDGHIDETITDDDGGTTHVNIDSSTSGSTNSRTRNSTSVNIRSRTTTRERSSVDVKTNN